MLNFVLNFKFIIKKGELKMKQVSVSASLRKEAGKSANHKLRAANQIPAIVYGPGKQNVMLSLPKIEFENVYKKNAMRAIYKLKFNENGKETIKTTLIKDIQYDPVKFKIMHVDFYEFDENKKIRSMVPIVTHGTPIGLKKGGILTHVKDQIEVECLPANLPEHLEIDVTNLDIHHSIRVSDLKVPDTIHIVSDPHDVIVTVASQHLEETSTAEAVAEQPAEPEVIAKGKAAKEKEE